MQLEKKKHLQKLLKKLKYYKTDGGKMKVVKQTDKYTVEQKRSGRYSVVDADGKNINGDSKAEILLKEGLIKKSVTTAPVAEEAPATEEAPAE